MFKKVCILSLLILIGLNVAAQLAAPSPVTKNKNSVPFRHWFSVLHAVMLTAYAPFNAGKYFSRSGLDFEYEGYIQMPFFAGIGFTVQYFKGRCICRSISQRSNRFHKYSITNAIAKMNAL